jgi:hypothetical protein
VLSRTPSLKLQHLIVIYKRDTQKTLLFDDFVDLSPFLRQGFDPFAIVLLLLGAIALKDLERARDKSTLSDSVKK